MPDEQPVEREQNPTPEAGSYAQPHRRLDVMLAIVAAVLITVLFVLLQLHDLSSTEFLTGMLIVVLASAGVRIVLALRSDKREN